MLLLYHPAGFSEKDNFQPLPVNFYPLELMFSPGRETSCEASNHSLPVKAKQPALLGGLFALEKVGHFDTILHVGCIGRKVGCTSCFVGCI